MSLAHDGICFCQLFKTGVSTQNPGPGVNERYGDVSTATSLTWLPSEVLRDASVSPGQMLEGHKQRPLLCGVGTRILRRMPRNLAQSLTPLLFQQRKIGATPPTKHDGLSTRVQP